MDEACEMSASLLSDEPMEGSSVLLLVSSVALSAAPSVALASAAIVCRSSLSESIAFGVSSTCRAANEELSVARGAEDAKRGLAEMQRLID